MILALDLGKRIFAAGYDGTNLYIFKNTKEILKTNPTLLIIGKEMSYPNKHRLSCYSQYKAIQARGIPIRLISEFRTSIVCPYCMTRTIPNKQRNLNCKSCKQSINRDFAGAMNIYSRFHNTFHPKVKPIKAVVEKETPNPDSKVEALIGVNYFPLIWDSLVYSKNLEF